MQQLISLIQQVGDMVMQVLSSFNSVLASFSQQGTSIVAEGLDFFKSLPKLPEHFGLLVIALTFVIFWQVIRNA